MYAIYAIYDVCNTIPITLTITVFTRAFPIPLVMLHLYIPSSSLTIDSTYKLPLPWTTTWFIKDNGEKSELSPKYKIKKWKLNIKFIKTSDIVFFDFIKW